MIKKITVLFIAILLISVAPISLAADLPPQVDSLEQVAYHLLDFIWPLFIFGAAVTFLIAGFLYVTANGDASKIKIANSAIIWACVGMVVGILAWSAPMLIGSTIGIGI